MMKTLQAGAVTLLLGFSHAVLLAQSPAMPGAIFPKRSVALAFLGSRLKLETVIAPLLEKYHFHATFFVVDPAVDVSTPVTLHLINAPYAEALRYISRLAGVTFSIERYAITVDTPVNRTGNIGTITPGSMNEEIDLETANIPRVDFTDASLDSVMNLLTQKLNAATGGSVQLAFVADPTLNVSKAVTLHAKNMPFTEVLRYVGEGANADFVIDRYAIYARTKRSRTDDPAPDVYAAPTPFALVR